jgi:flagellar motility protein MotE (MotC chaperone)
VAAAPPPPDPVDQAERALLGRLRERRLEIDAREAAISARESMLGAAERRLTTRLEEMAALQARLEALERGRGEREEAGWRGLVKTYETMRPRDAATVFDDLEMPVLVQIVNRMREAKAAPVIGAMRPDRARSLTAELARLRSANNRTD